MTRPTVPTSPSVQSRALAQLLSSGLRPIGDRMSITSWPQRRVVREVFDTVRLTPLPRGTRIDPVADGDISGLWLTGRGADQANGVVLYLHGGGFVFGSTRTHRHLAAALSVTTKRPVLLVDYRRAPEHPFPAAADDVLTAYKWLLKSGHAPASITVMGDSAGGHLTAGLLADLSRRRIPMPAAAVMFSPFLDLGCAEVVERDAVRRDPFVPPQRAMECGLSYAGTYALNHRRLNVLGASKRRWPPVLIQVGDTECLLGDSERMAESIRSAGGHCELQVWPGQVHVFPAFYPLIPEGRAAVRYVGDFVRANTVDMVTEQDIVATAS